MSDLRVQYIIDDHTEDIDKKCDFCSGVLICATKCCNKNLCQFHFRFGQENGKYMSCELCEINENIDDVTPKGFVKKPICVYCKEHTILTECEKCECIYYCNEHINNHECIKWITIEPRITKLENFVPNFENKMS